MTGAYLAIFSSRFRTLLQYRASAFAGAGTQLFFGLVRVMIFEAFYQSSRAVQPLSREQVVSYIWLGQAMLMLTLFGVETEVAEMIRSGTVAYEMTRPLDLYNLWFARALSGRAAPLLMRSLPLLAVAAFLGLQAPVSWSAGLLFALSIIGGIFLAAAMVALLTISMLWTVAGEGVSRLAPAFIFFCSGIIIPVPLFPGWLVSILKLLPFSGLIDTPFRIYVGSLSGAAAAQALLLQLLWIGLLVALGRRLLAAGLHRLVVQGG